ncbi:MAG TPA: LysM peptidoglycan-binding domain-containing protein [Candidatus Acidoferrum sp.]|nr:LysM peptidoglycan-binding domain-containing protein [Candidatus Acidoferrum sp.]
MRRIFFICLVSALCFSPLGRAQDAATQERLDRLSGKIDDLIARQEALGKRMDELQRELMSVREMASKPPGNWASAEDLKRVAKDIEEVDRKRVADSELVQKQLEKIRQALDKPLPPMRHATSAQPKDTSSSETPTKPEKPARQQEGVEHVIKPGETLSSIVAACREQHIKVTQRQILEANPGLKADVIIPGRKIFIPAVPQP